MRNLSNIRRTRWMGIKGAAGGFLTRRLAGKSRGQALIYISVMMLTLMAFAALVADGGLLFINRRQMQNAVDAAALAGVQQLAQEATDWDKNKSGARNVACEYAKTRNGVPSMTVDCATQLVAGDVLCSSNPTVDILVCRVKDTHLPNTAVRVTARKTYTPIIGWALPGSFKFAQIEIKTQATAMVGSLKGTCAFPIFQAQDTLEAAGAWAPDGNGNFVEYNVPVVMKTSSDDNISGNFMALDPNPGNGWNAWADQVASPGGCNPVYGSVETQTGSAVGAFDKGMEGRRDLWENSTLPGYCLDNHPTFNADEIAVHPAGHPLAGQPLTTTNCYRVVQFPLVAGMAADFNGTETAVIKGYLTFYISGWCGQNSDPPKGDPDSQHCPPPEGTTLPPIKWGQLWGYYLKYEAITDLPVQPYDGLGTKVIVLVQ